MTLEIGKRYEFIWPKNRPMMRLVGTVVDLSVDPQTLVEVAHVIWSKTAEPYKIQLHNARVREVDEQIANCFQYARRRGIIGGPPK